METYLDWVLGATPTRWWHDSADLPELEQALARGASGATTNPVLVATAMKKNPDGWRAARAEVSARRLPPAAQAEALTEIAVTAAADRLRSAFDQSAGQSGWVCAQVDPSQASCRDAMAAMARRFHAWRPNVTVKLPATAAGLDVLEDAVAHGITVTATVSFTVAQLVAIAERHRCGVERARRSGVVAPGHAFAVLMLGRLDDYLREVARDGRAAVDEADLQQAGLAVAKRAYAIYRERRFDTTLLMAAVRGSYHLTALAGADLIMSIHPAYQALFVEHDFPREPSIDVPVEAARLERLARLPEFVRAYEPDGLTPAEFITFGATQRTLGQFVETGWKTLEGGAV